MLERFVPEAATRFIPELFNQEITLKQDIHYTLGSIQAFQYQEISDFISYQSIRPGLKEFLDFLNFTEVPLNTISGGLTDTMRAVLKR